MNEQYEKDAMKGLDLVLSPIISVFLFPFWLFNKVICLFKKRKG